MVKKIFGPVSLHGWGKNLNMTNTGLMLMIGKKVSAGWEIEKVVAAKSENYGHRQL